VSVLLNGANQNQSGGVDSVVDRGWYDVDSDQIYYYTTSPSHHSKYSR
jgi:hypothetical protein